MFSQSRREITEDLCDIEAKITIYKKSDFHYWHKRTKRKERNRLRKRVDERPTDFVLEKKRKRLGWKIGGSLYLRDSTDISVGCEWITCSEHLSIWHDHRPASSEGFGLLFVVEGLDTRRHCDSDVLDRHRFQSVIRLSTGCDKLVCSAWHWQY